MAGRRMRKDVDMGQVLENEVKNSQMTWEDMRAIARRHGLIFLGFNANGYPKFRQDFPLRFYVVKVEYVISADEIIKHGVNTP